MAMQADYTAAYLAFSQNRPQEAVAIARIRGEAPAAPGDPDTVTVGQPPPGAMGLGTQVPVRQPPKGWVKPKKPDLLTKHVKGRK